MATGKSSNLGASSSSSTKASKEKKRKQSATRTEEAKNPRLFQAHRRVSGNGYGAAVPGAVPLHRAARAASNNMATAAFPFPMAGVNGAAPVWSTAAALGAASRAAALTLSSSVRGPAAPVVMAPAPSLQPPPAGAASGNAAAAALALPAVASDDTAVIPPLVLAPAGAGGELVPLPLQFVAYHQACRDCAQLPAPAPGVGIPLAAALDKIESGALGRMLAALTPFCNPPLRQHQSKTGPPPPWWPTGSEHWWRTELLEHLDEPAAAAMRALQVPVPFASSYYLRKPQKVAVLIAIVKHLAPDFARVAAAVRAYGELSNSEAFLWHSALSNEHAKYTRPMFVVLMQPPPPQQQQQAGVVVPGGNDAASEILQAANIRAPAGASVSAAPADGGRGEVIAAAEVEQCSDIDVGRVAFASTDAPAGDGRDQAVNNFPASGDGGSSHKQGDDAVAAAPPTTGHVSQVEAEPEMMMMQPEQADGGVVPGDDVAAAAAAVAEDEQVVHPVVVAPGPDADAVAAPAIEDVVAPGPNADAVAPAMEEDEAPEDGDWWYNSDELNRMFAEFESFGDVADTIWY